jgi:hypothetical protein
MIKLLTLYSFESGREGRNLLYNPEPEIVTVTEPQDRFCQPVQSGRPVQQPYLSYWPTRLHGLAESISGLLKSLPTNLGSDLEPSLHGCPTFPDPQDCRKYVGFCCFFFHIHCPAWWGGGCKPTPFIIFTITYKVVVYASAERTDTLPL